MAVFFGKNQFALFAVIAVEKGHHLAARATRAIIVWHKVGGIDPDGDIVRVGPEHLVIVEPVLCHVREGILRGLDF